MDVSRSWAIRRRNGGIDANEVLLDDPSVFGDDYGEWIPVVRVDEYERVVEERDRYRAALKRLKTHPVLTAGWDPLKAAGKRIVQAALREY